MTDTLLRLYVTGRTPSAERAIAALTALADETPITLQVIDVLDHPEAAMRDQVFATPTVIRVKPGPTRRVFGDLSSKEMLQVGLQLFEDPDVAA